MSNEARHLLLSNLIENRTNMYRNVGKEVKLKAKPIVYLVQKEKLVLLVNLPIILTTSMTQIDAIDSGSHYNG